MAQHYSDPRREADPYALPDIEVWYSERGALWQNDDTGELCDSVEIPGHEKYTNKWQPCAAGWFWWSCFPGCLPDSEPIGPFDSEDEALADARAWYGLVLQ